MFGNGAAPFAFGGPGVYGAIPVASQQTVFTLFLVCF